jgi:hypothetical protein
MPDELSTCRKFFEQVSGIVVAFLRKLLPNMKASVFDSSQSLAAFEMSPSAVGHMHADDVRLAVRAGVSIGAIPLLPS